MRDQALDLLITQDTFAAIDFLLRQPDAVIALQTFHDLLKHLYNEAKDVPGLIAIGRAGIQFGLRHAAATLNNDERAEFKGKAKAIAYDLASDLWPGWDEPGIVLNVTDLVLGLDAARCNLRLAQELQRAALPTSRAWWLLGAQRLANRAPADAKIAFERAAQLARDADSASEALLADGYAALVDVLGGADPAAFEAIKAELQPLPHGDFFVRQLDTALRVFSA